MTLSVGQAPSLRRRLTPPVNEMSCGAESPAQAEGLPHTTSLPTKQNRPTHEI